MTSVFNSRRRRLRTGLVALVLLVVGGAAYVRLSDPLPTLEASWETFRPPRAFERYELKRFASRCIVPMQDCGARISAVYETRLDAGEACRRLKQSLEAWNEVTEVALRHDVMGDDGDPCYYEGDAHKGVGFNGSVMDDPTALQIFKAPEGVDVIVSVNYFGRERLVYW